MRLVRAAVVALVMLLFAIQVPAAAVDLTSVPVTFCVDKRMYVVPQDGSTVNLTINSPSVGYRTDVRLSTGAGVTGVARSADGCWRFSAPIPLATTIFQFDSVDGPGPAFIGTCYPRSLTFQVTADIKAGDAVTLTLPEAHVVDVRTATPSGLNVVGADVDVKATATATIQSAAGTATATFTPGSADGWFFGPLGPPAGRCLAGSPIVVLNDPMTPIPVTGTVTYRTLGQDGTVTTLSAPFSDDAADGVDTALPFEVPDVAAAVPGAATAPTFGPASVADRVLSRTINYGETVALNVAVSTRTLSGDLPTASAPVVLNSINAYGRTSIVTQGLSGPDGTLTLKSGLTTTGRYLVSGKGFSSGSTWVDVKVRPQTPLVVAASAGRTSVTVTWSRPADGGSPLKGYVAQWAPAGGTWSSPTLVSPSATSWKVSGLVTGRRYSFRIASRSGVGDSPFTAVVHGIPGKPSTLTVVGAPRSSAAVLAWKDPATTGGFAIRGYEVQFKRAGSGTWSPSLRLGSTLRSWTQTGLVNGRSYDFRVRATNGTVPADWSTPSRLVVGSPTVPTSIATSRAVLPPTVGLTWAEPTRSNGAAVAGYVFQYRLVGSPMWTTVALGAGTFARDQRVALNRDYELRVAARNSRGVGPFSQPKRVTTRT